MNKRVVKDALILTAFTLVLGFILGGVHEITKERIDAAELAAKQAAYMEVFPEAADFVPHEDIDLEMANMGLNDLGYNDSIDEVMDALDAGGETIGYVVTVTAKDGSQDLITFAVGLENDRTVNGYSITEIGETPGLGDKAKLPEFYDQFSEKNVDYFEVVKDGGDPDEQILAITGATITSKAVTNGVNAALALYDHFLVE
ncbi:MAG: RnfABCDGE type electron transport complex subunit G [Lachnospiraceae bacterium]|nr:RnfABCDGE type electron transport complex subunit G [Lachnospiraceae bacterium]